MRLSLKLFREQAGLTQKDVASKLEIPLRTYQNYERSERVPSLETLCEIADLYGVSLDDLVGHMRAEPDNTVRGPKTPDGREPLEDVAKSIRRIRLKYGLTQDELGKVAGVSSMAVSQWENGRAVPRMGAIRAIANHFKITNGEVIDGTPKVPGRNKIAEARAQAGMTQKQLADALGITQQSVYYYEHGDRDIRCSTLIKISDVLGCTVPFLLGLESNCHEAADESAVAEEEESLVLLYRECSGEWRQYVMRSAYVSAFQTKVGTGSLNDAR